VTDADAIKALIGRYTKRVSPERVRSLSGSPRQGQMTFLMRLSGAGAWLLRAVRSDLPVGDHLSGCAVASQRELAYSRMTTLLRLQILGYQAPRVVRTRDGELTAEAGDWCASVTTYVEGSVLQPTLTQLRLLGAALGDLHRLPVAGRGPAPGRSCWHAGAAIPATRRLLAAARPLLSPDWRGLHAAFSDATEAIEASAPGLPVALTHNDAWPRNCLQTAPGQVTLIDWDTGGLGFPLLDLGRALAECHLDSDLPSGDPSAWLIEPDPQRITAVCQGYRDRRTLRPAELARLTDAIVFGVAFAGAIHLNQALNLGITGHGMDARLARLRNRLATADEIAHIASQLLRGGLSPPGAG
jgi:Ser/Thr protein kinase RdoA (MazF antagonist)